MPWKQLVLLRGEDLGFTSFVGRSQSITFFVGLRRSFSHTIIFPSRVFGFLKDQEFQLQMLDCAPNPLSCISTQKATKYAFMNMHYMQTA